MVLDRIENKEYVIMNNSSVGGGPVLRIPKTRGYYVHEGMMMQAIKIGNEYKLEGPNGEGWTLVNELYRNMKPNTWYLLPNAYSITLTSKQTYSMTVQQVYIQNIKIDLNNAQQISNRVTSSLFLEKCNKEAEFRRRDEKVADWISSETETGIDERGAMQIDFVC
jgi:hypothetical protein